MPRCDGRAGDPDVVLPCPDGKCDSSVRPQQGELMLCPACTEARFPIVKSTTSLSSTSTAAESVSSRFRISNNHISEVKTLPVSEVNETLNYIVHGIRTVL